MSRDFLVHDDGRIVKMLERGEDNNGKFLLVEHMIIQQGSMNGPHSHPILQETFTVQEGQMRFVIDGEEMMVAQGEKVTIQPNQVHQFWNVSEKRLTALHEIRPPGNHWEMFELIHKLEGEGKLNKKGIPKNPLWLGLAWEYIDGYIEGPPRIVQKVLFGGLSRLAKLKGYR